MTQQAHNQAGPQAQNPLTQQAPQQKKPQTIAGMLADPKIKKELALALPRHMDPDRLARIALTEFRKTPMLAECNPKSYLGAVIQCAQLGLEPGSGLGHAYLLPFKKNQKVNGNWQSSIECQLIIGYRGMIDLARRSGQVISLQAHAVYQEDKFDFAYGLEERLVHEPCRDTAQRGPMIAVYAVAKLVGGGHQIQVMWRSEVDAVRERSKASNNGPWVTDYEEMAKKTAIRKLFKYLPVSVELQRATVLDEGGEDGRQDNAGYFDHEVMGEVYDGEYQHEAPSQPEQQHAQNDGADFNF